MNSDVIRELILSIVLESGALSIPDDKRQAAFIKGEIDIQLDEFNIDSLTGMEICIGIELELNVSIVPDQLYQLNSLNDLESEILRLCSD